MKKMFISLLLVTSIVTAADANEWLTKKAGMLQKRQSKKERKDKKTSTQSTFQKQITDTAILTSDVSANASNATPSEDSSPSRKELCKRLKAAKAKKQEHNFIKHILSRKDRGASYYKAENELMNQTEKHLEEVFSPSQTFSSTRAIASVMHTVPAVNAVIHDINHKHLMEMFLEQENAL